MTAHGKRNWYLEVYTVISMIVFWLALKLQYQGHTGEYRPDGVDWLNFAVWAVFSSLFSLVLIGYAWYRLYKASGNKVIPKVCLAIGILEIALVWLAFKFWALPLLHR